MSEHNFKQNSKRQQLGPMDLANFLIESFFKAGNEGNLLGAFLILLLFIIPVAASLLLFGGAIAGYEACDRYGDVSRLGERGNNWIVGTGCTARNVLGFVREMTGYSSEDAPGSRDPNAVTPPAQTSPTESTTPPTEGN